jgi:hypothetical protein
MSLATETSSAVFLVRVWVEDGEVLRARIIENLDLADGRDEDVLVVGTADEIEQCVQDWLERVSNAAVTNG